MNIKKVSIFYDPKKVTNSLCCITSSKKKKGEK